MLFLEQEVTEGEFTILTTVMETHYGSAPASAFSEATQRDCETLVTKGILHARDHHLIGRHYVAPSQTIGAYLREKGIHRQS